MITLFKFVNMHVYFNWACKKGFYHIRKINFKKGELKWPQFVKKIF